MTPDGVHATSVARFCTSRPTLIGWNPSTSLSGRIASNTRRSASAPIAAGSGDCTRMPSCTSLRFSRSTTASRSASDARRRQPLEIGAQPGLPGRLQLAARRRPPTPGRRRRARCPSPGGRPARAVNAATAGRDLRANLRWRPRRRPARRAAISASAASRLRALRAIRAGPSTTQLVAGAESPSPARD